MISRLTFSAAVFAVLATATLTFAGESQLQRAESARSAAAAAGAAPLVVMPMVQVTGHKSR